MGRSLEDGKRIGPQCEESSHVSPIRGGYSGSIDFVGRPGVALKRREKHSAPSHARLSTCMFQPIPRQAERQLL